MIDVEQYIRNLNWSESSTDEQRTLVAGNLRGFAAFATQETADLQARITTAEARAEAYKKALERYEEMLRVNGFCTKFFDEWKSYGQKTEERSFYTFEFVKSGTAAGKWLVYDPYASIVGEEYDTCLEAYESLGLRFDEKGNLIAQAALKESTTDGR